MSQRMNKFLSLRDHLIIGKAFNVLSPKEIHQCASFIMANEKLDDNQFAEKTNRWMLDVPKDQRPSDKKRSAMWAIVSQSVEVKVRRRSV